MAGLVYGYLHNFGLTPTALWAEAMAALTARSFTTVHPGMSVTLVREMLLSNTNLDEERNFTDAHA